MSTHLFCSQLKIFFSRIFCSALGNLKGRLRRLQTSEEALQPLKNTSERQCCRRDCCNSGQNGYYGTRPPGSSSCCAGEAGVDCSDHQLIRKDAYSPLLAQGLQQQQQQLMPG
jgi:hypothetical protein